MQHPDEGTIHAWIDGALDSEGARAVETHVASCEECARLAAEARGLVAASSRILTALDDVPAKVIPGPGTSAKPSERITPRRWPMPFWMRTAAAVVVVAGVSALVMTGKLNSPERKRADMISSPATMEVAGMPDSAPMGAATPAGDLATRAPSVITEQAAGGAQPSVGRSNRVSAPKPGRPGSRTEGDRESVASSKLARTADEADQRLVTDRAAERTSDAFQKAKEETKDVAGAGSGGLQARDTSTKRSNVVAMATPSAAPPPAERRVSSALGKGTEPAAPIAEQNRLRVGVAGALSGRSAMAPSIIANAPITAAHPAVGCYALSLSPWSGGTIPFGAPPARIELDTLTSVQDAVRGYNLVHPARGTASNGAPYAYWSADRDSVYVTWRDDRRGVTLALPVRGEVMQGNARTFSTSARDGATQTTEVEARRISCRE